MDIWIYNDMVGCDLEHMSTSRGINLISRGWPWKLVIILRCCSGVDSSRTHVVNVPAPMTARASSPRRLDSFSAAGKSLFSNSWKRVRWLDISCEVFFPNLMFSTSIA